MGNHNLLDYCAFRLQAVNDAQFVGIDTAWEKDQNQQKLSKTITGYRTIHNEIAADV